MRRIVWLSTLLWMMHTGGADASLIVVSGDVNIGNPLTGSSGTTVNPDNQDWFMNLLGGRSTVLIQNEYTSFSSGTATVSMDTFFDSIEGVSSSTFSGTITSAVLNGVDLFVSALPQNAYSTDEIASMAGFLGAGGTLFLIGENDDFVQGPRANGHINAALLALGSEIRIVDAFLDPGVITTLNIEIDPLNAGVTSFSYGAASGVTGGTPLIRSLDASGRVPFVAYQRVPEPEASLLALLGVGLVAASAAFHTRGRGCWGG
jgi:hypothetical protein